MARYSMCFVSTVAVINACALIASGPALAAGGGGDTDVVTARLMLSSARWTLGRIDERYTTADLDAVRVKIRAADRGSPIYKSRSTAGNRQAFSRSITGSACLQCCDHQLKARPHVHCSIPQDYLGCRTDEC